MKRRCRRKGHLSLKRGGVWVCLDCLATYVTKIVGVPGVIVHLNTGKGGKA